MSVEIIRPEQELKISFKTETILEHLNKNEQGDGELFKDIFRDMFIFDKTQKLWYMWSKHVWSIDRYNLVFGAVEEIAKIYDFEAIQTAAKIKTLDDKDPEKKKLSIIKKDLSNRAKMLRSKNRRENILCFAHSTVNPLAITSNLFNQEPFLLACKNGVIDLKTGAIKNGEPSDYLTLSCNAGYSQDKLKFFQDPFIQNQENPCPLWEKTLLEIFSNDFEVLSFFQRVCGSALIGKIMEKKAYFLTGSRDNGKTLIFETLKDVLGQYSTSFKRELLLESTKNISAKDADPEIIKLIGKRFAFTSEMSDRDVIGGNRFKAQTGKDTISARDLYQSGKDSADNDFKAQHTFFIGTNTLPKVDDSIDGAIWERIIRIHLELNFVSEPDPDNPNHRQADKMLSEKLKNEHDGILCWLVAGCLEYQKIGLNIPKKVKMWSNEYKLEACYLDRFIEERCKIGKSFQEQSSILYNDFCNWWRDDYGSNSTPPTNKRFTIMLKKLGYTVIRPKSSYIVGLMLKTINI